MNIHILGVCGTFMGGVALLAREAGIRVSGSDQNVYPPMSTLLNEKDVHVDEGYSFGDIPLDTDQIVVGNVMRRGLDVIEEVLNKNVPYTSGPQWLYENILRERWVLAVAGTHGKTTTASMLAWILEYAGLKPGFLIGGVPENFGVSARLGDSPFFIVEADEYDTAFFDKRSKFVHYHPQTLVLNNLEYDHADIFPDLQAIQTQFHHLMRIVPSEGRVISNHLEPHLDEVIDMGCWSTVERFSGDEQKKSPDWSVKYLEKDGSVFEVFVDNLSQGVVTWSQIGQHNVSNGLAAIAAARHSGVPVKEAIKALSQFKGVKRRMQLRGEIDGVCVYDDFAHHPTAIKTTLAGLRANVGKQTIKVVLEPRSNTMRMGVHQRYISDSLHAADEVILYEPEGLSWNLNNVINELNGKARLFNDVDSIVQQLVNHAQYGDHILIMSNGGFGGIHEQLLEALRCRKPSP